jgi:hypothetical protein
MKFHKDGTLPESDEVFVFGSNLAGIHGAGAARVAVETFGAEYGYGVGYVGRSYAIPTKDDKLNTLKYLEVLPFIISFLTFAKYRQDLNFFVTAIGCGLAGYKHDQIAPLFRSAPHNCSLPDVWEEFVTYP